jgi:hypothetical protein
VKKPRAICERLELWTQRKRTTVPVPVLVVDPPERDETLTREPLREQRQVVVRLGSGSRNE